MTTNEANTEETCLDLEALAERCWPGDQILKATSLIEMTEIVLTEKSWKEWCDQMGSKRPEYVYGRFGKVKITGPKE